MFIFRCLRGDWAGMDDPSVYNCSVAVAEARAAKYVISCFTGLSIKQDSLSLSL